LNNQRNLEKEENMGLFDRLEKGFSKGADLVGDALNKVGEASEGWGERADAWLAKDDKLTNVKEKVAPTVAAVKEKAEFFAERAEETVTKVVNDVKEKAANTSTEAHGEDVDYINDDDIVAPEKAEVFVEEVVSEVPVTVVEVTEVVEPKAREDKKEGSVVTKTGSKGGSGKTKASLTTLSGLRIEAKELGIKGYTKLDKDALAKAVKAAKRKAAK
jgi:hypothetical protein